MVFPPLFGRVGLDVCQSELVRLSVIADACRAALRDLNEAQHRQSAEPWRYSLMRDAALLQLPARHDQVAVIGSTVAHVLDLDHLQDADFDRLERPIGD